MSAQQRYRSLVHHIGRIYAADNGSRTELLQAGLDDLMTVVGPSTSKQWSTVGADSDRLMKVWVAKEGNDDAARAVVEQLTDILRELASSTESVAPTLTVSEPIAHVIPVVKIKEEPITLPATVKITPVVEKAVGEVTVMEEKEIVVEVIDDNAEASEEEEVEEEEEVVEAEEDEEEEAEEEEEAGMEVEVITFRGRQYWMDVNSKKLYAFTGEDEDIGDEIGEVVNGKPAFYTTKK